MNCVKRAMCYISRKRTKSVLLLFIFMVAICTILGTLSVLEASASMNHEILKNTNAKITLESVDSENSFDQTDVQTIIETENINSVNLVSRSIVDPGDFYPVAGNENADNGKVTLLGYDTMEKDSPFEENVCRLVQGNFPKEENEIVINQNLADMNQIKIGDEITFLTDAGEEIGALVTGFYLTGNERQQTDVVETVNRIENQVYVSSQFVSKFNGGEFEKLIAYVDAPEKLEETAEELRQVLGDRAAISTMDTMYQKMKYTITQVERVTRLIFILTIITSIFVVGMLLCMWMRNRKVEIAVFISLGISKMELFIQMVIEIFVLYFGGMVVSAGIYSVFLSVLESWINRIEDTNFNIVFSASTIGKVWVAGNLVLLVLMAAAAISLFQKNIKDTLSEMEG